MNVCDTDIGTRRKVVRYVLDNPGCSSLDVAAALSSTVKIVGAHLMRASVARVISQHKRVTGNSRYIYGPPGWKPSASVGGKASVQPDDVAATMRARLTEIAAIRHRLDVEERVLLDALAALDKLETT